MYDSKRLTTVLAYSGLCLAIQSTSAAQPLCDKNDSDRPVDDIRVYDSCKPAAKTRVHSESDINIEFRFLADHDDISDDGQFVTHAVQNFQSGENSGLVFLWEEAQLSRPSTSPLRSLASVVDSRKLDVPPVERETHIRFSPSLARNTSASAYLLPGEPVSGKKRSTWSKVITEFVNEVGEVVDLLFKVKSTFESSKITYRLEVEPENVIVGIGQISGAMNSDVLADVQGHLEEQHMSVETIDAIKLVGSESSELPSSLYEGPLLLFRPDRLGRDASEATFDLRSQSAKNVVVPVIFLTEGGTIATAGASIFIP